MKPVSLLHPGQILFGNGTAETSVPHLLKLGMRRPLIITSPPLREHTERLAAVLKQHGAEVFIKDEITAEPDIDDFLELLNYAGDRGIDSVIGFGGGSVMDVAKLVAALYRSDQTIHDVFGIGNLNGRTLPVACFTTTAGTGSEVSPNAILLDKSVNLKLGIVSPHLVADIAVIDPLLTLTVPPAVTAATGMDALTHCMEAYTNVNAHPLVDTYAYEGMRLISRALPTAYKEGSNTEARAAVALGSLFGGFCLGPVNTAAVHALSYPLGGEFHIAHGLSNAVLLPHIMRFNAVAAPERYADVAVAIGAHKGKTILETAENGVQKIFEMSEQLNIPVKMSELDIPASAIDRMVEGAMKVTRLLVNNPRKITSSDARKIYQEAM